MNEEFSDQRDILCAQYKYSRNNWATAGAFDDMLQL